MRFLPLLTVLAVLVVPAAANAAATPGPYRTDDQAEQYLETQLPAWAGVNLHPPANTPDEYGFARVTPSLDVSCSNGRYGPHEERTHRHFAQRTTRTGEYAFRSFSCDLTAYADSDGDGQVTYSDDGRTFHLYLQTRPNGRWVVVVDR